MVFYRILHISVPDDLVCDRVPSDILEKVNDRGSIPKPKDPIPSRKAITSTVMRPDIISAVGY